MLDFDQIKGQYPEQLQGFERAILREYLQYKILQGLFESKLASQIAFLGGTALRIIYGNNRFSEDIDLDHFGLSCPDFKELIDDVVRLLTLEGFNVDVSRVQKAAFHCTIKFPDVLFEHGISPLREEKIRIQIDTFAQGYDYAPEIKILNKFDVFTQARVTPPSVLLSQKIYTAINRKRPKGRDFYDITFLFGIAKPDFGFLQQKMRVQSPDELKEQVLEKISDFDFKQLADDVAPFLIYKNQSVRVAKFLDVWEQVSVI
jgi:predicted nucleotidyltransferase component of viral defense system